MAGQKVSYSTRRSYPDEERPSVRISLQPSQFQLPTYRHSSGGSVSLSTRRYSGLLPVLFDRAARTWWDPCFDSHILEEQYRRSTFPQLRQRFQYALCYLVLASLLYCIYSASMVRPHWVASVVVSLLVSVSSVGALVFTQSREYNVHYVKVSLATTATMCAASLSVFLLLIGEQSDSAVYIFSVGAFSLCILVLMITYALVPMPLYIVVAICFSYSIVFEILSAVLIPTLTATVVAVRALLQFCVHLVGLHTRVMTEIGMRNTFFKVGQSLMVRRDLEVEKQLKEKMIHSVMPPKVADWLMATTTEEDDDSATPLEQRKPSTSPRPSQMIFRPFNMHRIENVSILFADIVGFTKMSSNKSAEQLVGLLNDLFGRFDYLCAKLGCEKISTLGDCYYCVSGCPEPRPDHARCCVEMGLGMIRAIGEFDEDTDESVNMRVGVHTGTVLCGIVGTKRFKFDVWSNDVSYANKMESTGKPGRVHISEVTHGFLVDHYHMEEGLPDLNRKTYFIRGRKVAQQMSSRHSWPHTIGSAETGKTIDTRKISCPSNQPGDIEEEEVAPMLPPAHRHSSLSTLNSSRKDSGIRSRQSSMQDTLLDMPTPLYAQRASGYCSSYTSVADTGRSSGSSLRGYSIFVDPALMLNESLSRLRHLRKQSDLQMIRCIQQDACTTDYFIRPPVNPLTLFFHDEQMERNYRHRLHHRDLAPTMASASFTTYFDIFVALGFYLAIMFACFVLFDTPLSWLLFCLFATCTHLCIFMLCIREILATRGHWVADCLAQIYRYCTEWYPWHVVGLVLVSLPIGSIFSNFTCAGVLSTPERTNAFCYVVFVSLLHFSNFTQLNFWLRSMLATCAGVVLALLVGLPACPCPLKDPARNVTQPMVISEHGVELPGVSFHRDSYSCNQSAIYEIVLHVVLNTVLVWLLNREFEISYRLSFHGSAMAARDEQRIQAMKNQADWLLHNIIPRHVAEQLKNTSKYSENHRDAGIIFASIVNFHEMYDESYEGGKEFLRVLNELVGDFDELLSKPVFRNVTKIKTIGSTFMAASGLNPKLRRENPHPFTHLYELMDFALTMQQVIENFNQNLLEFNFVIRIGYCYGDVTAGVIGTTKLYYDIWGDAVNIASRMDSYGVPGRIQVPEHCLQVLQEMYVFEPRGSMYIKGKDNMNVHLLVRKKDKVLYRILPSTHRTSLPATAVTEDKEKTPAAAQELLEEQQQQPQESTSASCEKEEEEVPL
ncbi:adenylate cyclase type 9 [Ixodes scapularis]|uniref:adenylate cyclase type 9 n=1 Tax=Ixodes scapularis TaxID=6945 RepID=UPI001A9FC03F|nr:adenylate cyclase type 9 [Ixodes scapularis]XP_042145852.1 adenylate cyclase type 9 [Ixodes scapularis]XP_042145853.1 adenylate cyclase type 9 [Ixodes scapularis]